MCGTAFPKGMQRMEPKGFISVLLLLLVALCDGQVERRCGTHWNTTFSRFDFQTDTLRLVGGVDTEPHAYPWMVEILLGKNHQCGGSLIDVDTVVTAAHCFSKTRNPNNYSVLIGGHEIFSGKHFAIQNISIHPLYQIQASAYDVALMRITPSVDLMDPHVNIVCLPTVPVFVHQVCAVTGWGRILENGPRPNALREIHVPIISPLICNDDKHYNGRIHHPSMLCAGYADGKIDACQGDSGGPLMCLFGDQWQLQGIVSWGIGCAQPSFPGVYTRVLNMVGWIRTQQLTMKMEAQR